MRMEDGEGAENRVMEMNKGSSPINIENSWQKSVAVR